MQRVFFPIILLLFSSVGIKAQDIWESLQGPQGVDFMTSTSVNCFLKLGGDTIFTCTDDGVAISLDEAASWQRRSNGLQPYLRYMEADNAGTMIVVSDRRGAFRSSDAGLHWHAVSKGLHPPSDPTSYYDLKDIAYNHFNSTWYISASVEGLFTSTDGGTTWEHEILDTLEHYGCEVEVTQSGNVIFAGSGPLRVLTLSDGKWRTASVGASHLLRAGSRVYAYHGSGFAFSDDEGLTWSNFREGPADLRLRSLFDVGQYGLIAMSESIFMTTGAYSSQDTGRTWTAVDGLWNAQEYLGAMILLPSRRMIGGDWNGVLRSDTAGKNWTRSNTGLIRDWVMDVALTPKGDLLTGSVFSTSIYSPSQGWRQLNQETSHDVHVAQDGTLFCLTATGMIRSTDDGQTWKSVDGPFGSASQILESRSGELYCGIMNNKIYRSTDAGQTWDAGTVEFEKTSFDDGLIDIDGSLILLVKDVGVVRVDSALTRTTVLLSADITGRFNTIVTARDGGLVVAAENGVYYSSDRGLMWREIPLPNSLKMFPWGMDTDQKGRVYCLYQYEESLANGRNYLLFATPDLGKTWEQIELWQPYPEFGFLKVLPDDHLYLASRTEGLFRTRDVITSIEQPDPPAIPDDNSITAWPQPAKEHLSITWRQSIDVHTIVIHDCMGRLMLRRDIRTDAAVSTLSMNVRGLQLGMYIVSLVADTEVLRKRVMVAGGR